MYLMINLGGLLSNRSNHGGLAGAKVEGAGVKMCHLADAQRHDGVDHDTMGSTLSQRVADTP
jgi:hypothetical protein